MKAVKTCFFIGHADTPENVYPLLYNAIERCICEKEILHYYVGNHGAFDRIVIKALQNTKTKYPLIHLSMLLPYHPDNRKPLLPNGFDELYYPFEEKVMPNFAIPKANMRMIDMSDYLIAYVRGPGKSRDFLEYAQKRKKQGKIIIENIALYKPHDVTL